MNDIEKIALELLCGECDLDPEDYCPGLRINAEDALRAIVAAFEPQWQPIETAPKDGRPLLLDHPGWHMRVLRGGWDAHEQAWRAHGFGCPATQPTHWQPLPAAAEVP